MRVVYVCADRGIPLLGDKGASVHLRSLASALARRGNQVTLACRNVEGQNPAPSGVRVERIPDEGDRGGDRLGSLCREVRAEVVLERYSLSSGPARVAADVLGVPQVLEINAPLVDEAARYRGLTEVERWRGWEGAVFGGADRLIAVSTGVKAHIEHLDVAASRVTVIHNGVDVDRFHDADGSAVRARHNLGDATVVGFSGSLKPWHGVDALLEAFAKLPSATRLLIAGDGPEGLALRRLADVLGIADRTVFSGAVPHDRMPEYLAAMDVGVAPYEAQSDFYFSPLKVVEYLAAGLALVTTEQGDLGEMVGDAGLLVPPGDTPLLAAALGELCGDPARRRSLGEAASARSLLYDWDTVAGRVEQVLTARGVAAC